MRKGELIRDSDKREDSRDPGGSGVVDREIRSGGSGVVDLEDLKKGLQRRSRWRSSGDMLSTGLYD